jgi:hypothetical protein
VNILESIASGLASIWSHKLRSALTLFGIVVGVASVVAMFSFVGGISDRIMEDFEELGYDNVFFVGSMRPDNPDDLASLKVSKGLTFEDTRSMPTWWGGRETRRDTSTSSVSPRTAFR